MLDVLETSIRQQTINELTGQFQKQLEVLVDAKVSKYRAELAAKDNLLACANQEIQTLRAQMKHK